MSAKGFLCYGDDGIQLNLEEYGNVVLIKGKNYSDIHKVTGKPGSNGAGKSTVPQILCFAFYGQTTIPEHNLRDIVHKKCNKAEVEVIWDDYRLTRTVTKKGKHDLRLWESKDKIWTDDTEVTAGSGVPGTQKEILRRLGLNFNTFVSLLIFDDRADNFLESDTPTKREIVENLLSLDKYRHYSKMAKQHRDETQRKIKDLTLEYDLLKREIDISKNRIINIQDQEKAWKNAKINELQNIKHEIAIQKEKLEKTNNDPQTRIYEQAQLKIYQLNSEAIINEQKADKVSKMIMDARQLVEKYKENRISSLQDLSQSENQFKQVEEKIKKIETENLKMKNAQSGVICNECFMEIDVSKYKARIIKNKNEKEVLQITSKNVKKEIEEKNDIIKKVQLEIGNMEAKIALANEKLQEFLQKNRESKREVLSLSSIEKPEVGRDKAVLEQKIEDLKKQEFLKLEEVENRSPYTQIINDAILEYKAKIANANSKKEEIEKSEKLLPYYKFWVDAFGDDGIRKFVIDGIVPALNSQIAYWLDILIYGNISMKFDNMFKASIERHPHTDEPFVYHAMSGGERRRLRLALKPSFAHIMELNSGFCPSVLFLDEVAVNIDENGVEHVYDMIRELSQSKQVFVTTHDPSLLELFQGCQTIELERRDGFTKLVKS